LHGSFPIPLEFLVKAALVPRCNQPDNCRHSVRICRCASVQDLTLSSVHRRHSVRICRCASVQDLTLSPVPFVRVRRTVTFIVPRFSLGPVLFPVIIDALSVPVKLTPNPFLSRPRPVSGHHPTLVSSGKTVTEPVSLGPALFPVITRPLSVPVKLSSNSSLRRPRPVFRLSPVHAFLVQVKLTLSPSPFVWSFSLKLPVTLVL